MPITLGPQASCSSRYPRYGRNIDPTINPSTTNKYAAARAAGPGRGQEGRRRPRSVSASSAEARSSTTSRPSTSAGAPRAPRRRCGSCTPGPASCTRSGYASGYYSSAASGIRMIDDARVSAQQPDHRSRTRSGSPTGTARPTPAPPTSAATGGSPTAALKQYQGGHNETWGGVTINIDRNYLKLRTPKLPGSSAPAPAPTGAEVHRHLHLRPPVHAHLDQQVEVPQDRRRDQHRPDRAAAVPAQAAALYRYEVTGVWNRQTLAALHRLPAPGLAPAPPTRRVVDGPRCSPRGNAGTVLRSGMTGPTSCGCSVPSTPPRPAAPVSGTYGRDTGSPVAAYQRAVGIKPSGVVGPAPGTPSRQGRR